MEIMPLTGLTAKADSVNDKEGWMISGNTLYIDKMIFNKKGVICNAGWSSYKGKIRKIIIKGCKMQIPNNVNVTFAYLFSKFKKLQSVDIENVDLSRVQSMERMFDGCVNLNSVNFRRVDVSHVKNFEYMFFNCNAVNNFDALANWNINGEADIYHMFAGCYNFRDGLFADSWGVTDKALRDAFEKFYEYSYDYRLFYSVVYLTWKKRMPERYKKYVRKYELSEVKFHEDGSSDDGKCPYGGLFLHVEKDDFDSQATGSTVTADAPKGLKGKTGIQCQRKNTVYVGELGTMSFDVYAPTKKKLLSACNDLSTQMSNASALKVTSLNTVPAANATEYKDCSIWWAQGILSVEGLQEGESTVTLKIGDNEKDKCQVAVVRQNMGPDEGNAGSVKIGQNQQAATDGNAVSFFPNEWSFASSSLPVSIETEENDDGSFTTRLSIGIGGVFEGQKGKNPTEWLKYKSLCDQMAESNDDFDKGKSAYNNMCKEFKDNKKKLAGYGKGKGVEVSFAGYAEVKYDKKGNLISKSGKIAGNLDANAEFNMQFMTPIGPVYLALTVGGNLEMTVQPNFLIEKDMDNYNVKDVVLDGELTLTPSLCVEGGYGIAGIATIGAYGKAEFPMDIIPQFRGEFNASAGIKVHVIFVLDEEYKLVKYSKKMWGNWEDDTNKKVNEKKLKLLSTKKLTSTEKAWSGKLKNSGNGDLQENILQEGILPSSIPMVQEIDNKKVMVWQAYNEDKSKQNCVNLMYSVLQNGVWSKPQRVYNNDDFADSYADLKVINGKLYLTWQRTMKEIQSKDTDKILNEAGQYADIYYSVFDSNNNKFRNVTNITNNTSCEMLPQFVENSNKVQIAYISNSKDSLLQSEGENTINIYDLSSGIKKQLCVSPGTIERYTAYEENGVTKAIYVSDTHNIEVVMQSNNESMGDLTRLISKTNMDTVSSMTYEDGTVQIVKNGELNSYDLKTQKITKYKAGSSPFGSNVVYCTNGSKAGYVWSTYDENTDVGKVVASMKTDDGFSEPIVIYQSKGGIPRVMAPILSVDGTWEMVVNKENKASEKNALCYYVKEESVDSELVTAEILPYDKKENLTGVSYSLKNKEDSVIDEIEITVTAEDGLSVGKTIKKRVNPGELVSDVEYMDLSHIPSGQKMTISVVAKSEMADDNNAVTTDCKKADVAVVGKAVEDNGKVKIEIEATNQSDEDANVKISLFKDVKMTEKVSGEEKINIAKNTSEKITFMVPMSNITYNENNVCYLMAKADVVEGDYDESNNVTALALFKGEKIDANTHVKKVVDKTEKKVSSDVKKTDGKKNQITTVQKKKIKVGKVKIKSAKNKKKQKLLLQWGKIKNAKGYQLQYALNKKFKKKKSIQTKKTKYTIKKLKKKKTYYIRVRAYKMNGKKKVYGKWSTVKKVKIKK